MISKITQKPQVASKQVNSPQNGSLALPHDYSDSFQSRQILPVIESIATGAPETIVPQQEAAKFVANLSHLRKNNSRIEKIYRNTRIDTRRLALNVMSEEAVSLSQQNGTIQARMELFQKHAVPLAERVAAEAIATASAKSSDNDIKDDIGLVVFVTSTGFVGPGVDAILIERLGLRRDTARTTVSFMGCAAAMNGLRVACDHVRAYPKNKVLLVCLELSSVNTTFEDTINDVIIHSIFGDGCAAVVVGSCRPVSYGTAGKLVIRDHLSYLVDGTQDGIILGIRDTGITCKLSRQLPDYIETGVDSVIQAFLEKQARTKEDIDLWAVHPGGTRIIEKVQSSLGLSDVQVADSWSILQDYGNMLSVSILFVIARMMDRVEGQSHPSKKPITGLAFSFSPGIGIEGVLFEKH